MAEKITMRKVMTDDHMVTLEISVSNVVSVFCNEVYVGQSELANTVARLEQFKTQIYGGICDLRFGEFGPEYAAGGFHARLQFIERGKICITIHMQTNFFDFGKKHVANEAHMHLMTEPALLDDFIRALDAISNGHCDEATLEVRTPWQ
ncbi:hypothetical protein GTP44_10610 [Duganella sp. FT50W]|uniref:Uncharacterized protein n=1 Tax=Duganella lactea TaxID=2692173 RepID=A0A6L8MKG8_9BURK|nr:hypothetical protein [Duganella lactea]MYM35514.1 hypothetical protein [Duganella lactea]MYM82402.1 hypothetical protein [Duganella lactea]